MSTRKSVPNDATSRGPAPKKGKDGLYFEWTPEYVRELRAAREVLLRDPRLAAIEARRAR